MTSAPATPRSKTPPKAQNKTQHVYNFLMESIVDGSLPAGSSINIATLAKQLDVSLIPTREALRRLESEGLVEFLFHRGVRVTSMTSETYREIMQTEAVLEGLAVGLAAPHISAEQLARARQVNTQMNEALLAQEFHAYHLASMEFHSILREPCPNTHLREMLDRGQQRIAAVRASVIGYRGTISERLSSEHEHLLTRLEEGASTAEIERLMRDHREGTIAADSENFRKTTEDQA